MIRIKLLEINERKEAWALECYPEFVKALNSELGYKVETVFEPDNSFDGYYLIPVGGGAYLAEKYKNRITNKSFLLGAFNADIHNYIEKFKPAGLTNWQLFIKASTAVIGVKEVIKKVINNEDDMVELHNKYADYCPYEGDGTYETVAKSILSYLEVYDKHLKDK